MITPEEMKQTWEGLDRHIRHIDSREQIDEKRRTALQRLSLRYRRFSFVGLAMIPVGLLIMHSGIFPTGFRVYLGVAYALYALVAFVMDWWLYTCIRSIDIYRMGVCEVSRKALLYRRRHHQFMAVLIPLAAALIATFVVASVDDLYMIAGIVTGAVAGLFLGIRVYRRFMSDYRSFSDD